MWHKIEHIAGEYKISAEQLIEFARENAEKYGVLNEDGHLYVNTWNVEGLVNDFAGLA